MKQCRVMTMLALAAISSSSIVAAAPALPQVLSFSAGYKLGGEPARNIVELGVVYRCDSRICMDTQRFNSAQLLPRTFTSYRHRMRAPYGRPGCQDGLVGTVEPGRRDHEFVRMVEEENGFVVATSTSRYRWVVDPAVDGAYTLTSVETKNEQAPLQQVVGFAFQSTQFLKGDLNRLQLDSFYRGEIQHKTADMGAMQPWKHAPSSIDFRVYEAAADGKLLYRSLPGAAAVVKKYAKPMWVHSTVVLARSNENIASLVQEYGHDFDMNGCFDEQGHNKFMLPISDPTGQVVALVYVEYTSDLKRGFPMLSVGRYYR